MTSHYTVNIKDVSIITSQNVLYIMWDDLCRKKNYQKKYYNWVSQAGSQMYHEVLQCCTEGCRRELNALMSVP